MTKLSKCSKHPLVLLMMLLTWINVGAVVTLDVDCYTNEVVRFNLSDTPAGKDLSDKCSRGEVIFKSGGYSWTSSNEYSTVWSKDYQTATALFKAPGRYTIKYKIQYYYKGIDKLHDYEIQWDVNVKDKNVAVTDISLSPSSKSISEGQGFTIYETIYPSNATNKNVSWKSSNTSIASVNDSGYVSAKSAGSATITCTAKDGSGVSATCYVTVEKASVKVTDISLSPTSKEIAEGGTFTISATVSPSNATDKSVSWKSSNTSVATVDSYGKVTGKSAGSATITCTANDGSGKSATCSVTVKKSSVKVTGISLSPTSKEITEGGSFTISATVSPSNATDKSVSWKSSNTSVATVDSNGKVTGKSAGSATITCTANDGSGKSATCSVTVKKAKVSVTSISLSPSSKEIAEGESFTIWETVYPSDATDKSVSWKSSNTSVATVSSYGTVTGVGSGNATITCSAQDGSGVSATCEVNVYKGESEIEFEYEGLMYTVIDKEKKTCATKTNEYGGDYDPSETAKGDFTIPAKVYNGNVLYTVTEIGKSSFSDCGYLTSVKIPDTVTVIGDHAFSWCNGVMSVEIPNSVIVIGSWAFSYCSSLTYVQIPYSVIAIGDCAFIGCTALSSVYLPANIEHVGANPFSRCENMVGIIVDPTNKYYSSIDGCLYDKSHELLIGCPGAKSGDFIIPDTVNAVDDYAFHGCKNLVSIEIPNSVTSIGEHAFSWCIGLSSIEIPNSVTSIGDYAFAFCDSLASIEIPNSVTSISDLTFGWCTSLASIEIPNSVTSLGVGAFDGCSSLASIDIPDSVTYIGEYAFAYCESLAEINYITANPIEADFNVFYDIYGSAVLNIAVGGLEKAMKTAPWKYFSDIREKDFSGIEEVIEDLDADAPMEVYDLNGTLVSTSVEGLAPGLYIIRQGGRSHKVRVTK